METPNGRLPERKGRQHLKRFQLFLMCVCVGGGGAGLGLRLTFHITQQKHSPSNYSLTSKLCIRLFEITESHHQLLTRYTLLVMQHVSRSQTHNRNGYYGSIQQPQYFILHFEFVKYMYHAGPPPPPPPPFSLEPSYTWTPMNSSSKCTTTNNSWVSGLSHGYPL